MNNDYPDAENPDAENPDAEKKNPDAAGEDVTSAAEPVPLVEPGSDSESVGTSIDAGTVEMVPTRSDQGAVETSAEHPALAPVENAESVPTGSSTAPDVTPAEPTYIPPTAPGTSAPITPEPAPVQTVYVTAPVPPRQKSNRGFGVLLAVVGAVVFTALFAIIIAVVLTTTFGGSIPGNSFALFLSSTGFLVPAVTFLVVFALTAVILNRAGWWAWVIGSLVAAIAVYFGSIGGILLLGNVVGMTPDEANIAYSQLAVSAPVVAATILTREVIIWFGLAIAAKGRRVKAHNVEARAAYDRELAENRARYGA